MISILEQLWNVYLFEPTFNLLIWLYNNWTGGNLGWAIVLLTVMLRLALLPLTIVNQLNKSKNKGLDKEIEQIEKNFKNDPVMKKQKIRETLKEKRIRPWAKATSLGIQVLVLVLLYEVFIYGVNAEALRKVLYDFIDVPGHINTIFFGFELGASYNLLWSGIVGGWLFLESYWELKQSQNPIEKKDLAYLFFFPVSVFVILYILPAVKALFVISSMAFTVIIGNIVKLFISNSVEEKES